MNQINQQISRAQRRLVIGQFVRTMGICLFAGLMLAAIGLAIPKIWHLGSLDNVAQQSFWNQAWIGSGIALGLIGAFVWTWFSASDQHEAALEVDQRFNLKERVSSALALSETERNSDAGRALVNDANDRADLVEIGEQFKLQPNRQMLLPVLPAALLGVLLLVPNAVAAEVPEAAPDKAKVEIKKAVEEAKKKLKKKVEELQAKGLKDADADLKSLAKKIDNLSSGLKESSKKEALVKLNNVKKDIEDRRRDLGGSSKDLKKQLNSLKKFNDGPAEKVSKAINEGDFKEAKNAIKDLVKKIKQGKLSETEKKRLASDLQKLADDLKKMNEKFEQKKQEVKDQIKKAKQEGDLEKAAKMQQKLDKMQQQDKQQQKLKKMAQALKQCSDCMKQGNGQPKQGQQGEQGKPGDQQGSQPSDAQMEQAMESLEDLEDMMDKMDGDMDELQDLEDMMEQIEAAKDGCQGCEGQGPDGKPKWADWAKGGGNAGGGKRDKQETETGSFKSRVKGTVQQGETVITGHADGNNIAGKSISEIREIAKASMNKKSDPLENQKLPRAQRDHAQEYFNSLRGN